MDSARKKTKLLAINFGGIGDEILFLPVLQSIRSQYGDWHISLLLEPRSQSVSQVTNLIDDVITFDIKKKPLTCFDLLQLLTILRHGNFDIVLSSGSSILVSALLFLSGIKTRIGYDSGWLSRFLLTNSVPLNRAQYASYMYHDLVKGLCITTKAKPPAISVLPANKEAVKQLLTKLNCGTADSERKKLILIHPGTSQLAIKKGIIKTWHVNNWLTLIEELSTQSDMQIVLAGGPDDQEIIDLIQTKTRGMKLICTAGLTKNLSDLAALISLCNLLVCVDSAPMHLAVALQKPLVALFGPTQAEKLLPDNRLFCALASKSSVELTSLSSKSSGVAIDPDDVFQAIMTQLRLTQTSK